MSERNEWSGPAEPWWCGCPQNHPMEVIVQRVRIRCACGLLFAWAWPHIQRGVMDGMPQWYKDVLAESVMAEVTP